MVRDVDVAHQDELTLAAQSLQVREEGVEEAELGALPILAAGAAGKVAADDAEAGQRRMTRAVESQFDAAALGIELLVAEPDPHLGRLAAAVQADARIALLLRAVEVAMQPGDLLETAFEVAGLGLELLHTEAVDVHRLGPGQQALVGGRADAVEVERDESEQGRACR